ncbi:MAG: hypothetical protein AAGG68_15350 [Bacteroidota bacterium]
MKDSMETHNDQINIYYDPAINKHKKTVAHAKSIGKVLAISFEDMPEAYNVWMTIWEGINKDTEILFDEKHPKYEQFVKGQITNFEDWRKVAINNTDMIKNPIAVKGKEVLICERQTEIYEFMDIPKIDAREGEVATS